MKDAHDEYYKEVRAKQKAELHAERIEWNRRAELASRPANRRDAARAGLAAEIERGLLVDAEKVR